MATVLESWEVTAPVLPRRARFYPLEPIGVGTPLVEGLTGYLLRLADAHAVPVIALTEELRRGVAASPGLLGAERDSAVPYGLLSYSANGVERKCRQMGPCLECGHTFSI